MTTKISDEELRALTVEEAEARGLLAARMTLYAMDQAKPRFEALEAVREQIATVMLRLLGSLAAKADASPQDELTRQQRALIDELGAENVRLREELARVRRNGLELLATKMLKIEPSDVLANVQRIVRDTCGCPACTAARAHMVQH